MKIGIFILTTHSQLDDFLPRVVWYLYPLRHYLDECKLYVSFKIQKKTELLDCFDKVIYSNLRSINISFVFHQDILDFSFLFDLDYVFLVDDSILKNMLAFKEQYGLSVEVIRIDHTKLQYADSCFLRFAEKIPNLHKKYKKISKNKILSLLKPLKTEKIYLFGTGPNSRYAFNYDYSDGLVIVCNSIVINKEVIKKLKPKIFVMADPIFHAGPSSYAEKFRNSLVEMFEINPCYIVVPLRDYHIYTTYLPNFMINFLIPIFFKIPSKDENPFFIDIFKSFEVKLTNNILTLFQLPLAASLGSEIYIIGCDGRPKAKNSYFWSHNEEIQINDKLVDIRQIHKGFFQIEYNSYYGRHIYFLTRLLNELEKNKKRVINLTPSYITPLQERITDVVLKTEKEKKANYDLSLIIPIFNMQEYIENNLNSLLEIQNLNYEIIAIDNFSEDSSLDLLLRQTKSNDKIKIYQNFKKVGQLGAIETGLEVATGKYVLILDCDSILYLNKISIFLHMLTHNQEKKILFNLMDFISEKDYIFKNYNYTHSYSSFIFEREFVKKYIETHNDFSIKKILKQFSYLMIKSYDSIAQYIINPSQSLQNGNFFFKQKEYELAFRCYNIIDDKLKKYIDINIELCKIFQGR
ncbi:TPA: glycosyltransferase family 2 protein [Campylobacter jejuni]|uniref:glycosyltransferase family 2 protein n=1 Tax=Campylobacter jejuni TaxID=197 RepID=UPI000F808F9A|nr:glycosyltransferase family A protein [Campylobacter jejuni]RTJ34350.1 glycosyltransferase family 2 protein [Campylobacter jejuni]